MENRPSQATTNPQCDRNALAQQLFVPFLIVTPVMLKGHVQCFSYPHIVRDDNDYIVHRCLPVSALERGVDNITSEDWPETSYGDPLDEDGTWAPEPIELFFAALSGWQHFEDGYFSGSSVEDLVAFGLKNVTAHYGYDGLKRLPQTLPDCPVYAAAYATQLSEMLTMVESVRSCGEYLYRLASNNAGRFYLYYCESLKGDQEKGIVATDFSSTNQLFVMSKHGDTVLIDALGNHFWYVPVTRPLSIPLDQLPCPVSYLDKGVMRTGWFVLMRYGEQNACAGKWFTGVINRQAAFHKTTGEEAFINGDKRRFECESDIILTPSLGNLHMPCVKPRIGDFVQGNFACDAYIASLNYYRAQLLFENTAVA